MHSVPPMRTLSLSKPSRRGLQLPQEPINWDIFRVDMAPLAVIDLPKLLEETCLAAAGNAVSLEEVAPAGFAFFWTEIDHGRWGRSIGC